MSAKRNDNYSGKGGEDIISDVAVFLKIFSDKTRIRLLNLLLKGEMNVGELSQQMHMSQSAISHQLRVLRHNNLVTARKDGKNVYYSIYDEHVKLLLNQCIVHVTNTKERLL